MKCLICQKPIGRRTTRTYVTVKAAATSRPRKVYACEHCQAEFDKWIDSRAVDTDGTLFDFQVAVRTYKTYAAAVKDMPTCCAVDDVSGIEAQAERDCESPIALLRDMVRTELDLIDEGEEAAGDYNARQRRSLYNYWLQLCGSA
jgi:uncharacterized protein YlaI